MNNADMPAMPYVVPGNVTIQPYGGLTKRECMAMHIMAGMISGGHLRAADAKQMPELAVLMTDKLLAELGKPQ